MPIELIPKDDGFQLARTNRGLRLVIDCGSRLDKYNAVPDIDQPLYADFGNVDDGDQRALSDAIRQLEASYGLRGHLSNRGVVPNLADHLGEIRDILPVTAETIGDVTAAFAGWRSQLGTAKVSTAKLLHFINPGAFWIIDSRVLIILEVWGYDPSFRGFGEFLEELMCDDQFDAFRTFLVQRDARDSPFLKLIDKVLLW